MEFSYRTKRLLANGLALGVLLQIVLRLSDSVEGRNISVIVYPLVGIGLLTVLAFYANRQKVKWPAILYALLFAWPVAGLLQLLLPDWSAFCLQTILTVSFLWLSYRLFEPTPKRLWLKLGLTTTVFIVWYYAVSFTHLYLARLVLLTTYFN